MCSQLQTRDRNRVLIPMPHRSPIRSDQKNVSFQSDRDRVHKMRFWADAGFFGFLRFYFRNNGYLLICHKKAVHFLEQRKIHNDNWDLVFRKIANCSWPNDHFSGFGTLGCAPWHWTGTQPTRNWFFGQFFKFFLGSNRIPTAFDYSVEIRVQNSAGLQAPFSRLLFDIKPI